MLNDTDTDYDPRFDPAVHTAVECYVAGRLSTMPPFAGMHPTYCLPYARAALQALSEVIVGSEPSDPGANDD